MGNIASQFATAFRDFATDGVASSGPHEVIKSDVRRIGPLLEKALATISLGSVDVIKDTRAALEADLAYPANSVGLVYGDPTDANNDLYLKSGASGAGAWTATTFLQDVIQRAAEPYSDLAQAWAEGTLPGGAGTKSAREYSLDTAQLAASATASAATALAAAGPNYASTAAGLAATTIGQVFAVDEGATIAVYRHDAGPVATFLRRWPKDINASDGSAQVGFIGLGTGADARTVQDKLRETVSVFDFMSPTLQIKVALRTITSGDATACTAAIQEALNYCLANGVRLYLPKGKYLTNAPLVIDDSASSADPTDGGFIVSLFGDGPAATQISSDHNGKCIDFTGGASAGWHTYFYIDGIGITKANKARDAGSVGLNLNDCAFAQFQRFDISYFEYGVYGEDVLSSAFVDGTIRLNNYGWRFAKGNRSHPNNIQFRGVVTLNNHIWGGQVIQPSLFNYIGGSIESNGFTGTPGDANSWGVDIQNGGTEGAVAVNFIGAYIEGNNGRADVKITSDTQSAVYNFVGCSFLRFTSIASRFTTNNIFFNSITNSRLVLSGCGFKDLSPYTSSAAREFVAANNAQVLDGGGNVFLDTAGGFTGVNHAIFAPIGVHHQLPFASLPSAATFRNGIQYCADGGGGTSRPALAVSDGTQWWQIVLGRFDGSVQASGTANTLPRGWSVSKTGTGIYAVTHNLNITGTQYAVQLTRTGLPGNGRADGVSKSNNTFEVYTCDASGTAADRAFDFTLAVI